MCKIALQIANWYEKKNIYLNAIFVPGKLNGRQRIQTPNIYRRLETFFTDFQDYFLNLEDPQRSIRQRLEQRP
jgi:hypothetical protein